MAHASETEFRLNVERLTGEECELRGAGALSNRAGPLSNDVWLVALPSASFLPAGPLPESMRAKLVAFVDSLGPQALVVLLVSPEEAAQLFLDLSAVASFQLWVSVKLSEPVQSGTTQLPFHHAALLVFSKYRQSLQHTKTRIAYTFCPACDKTTKDYGGKKHTYHHYGTLASDVWRDLAWSPNGDLSAIEDRLADLFAVDPHRSLHVWDLRGQLVEPHTGKPKSENTLKESRPARENESRLLLGDCLDQLRGLPSDSLDFCFADPPYNIAKKYDSWDDALDLRVYFQWCDQWLDELARVLRPGCTCAVLNIPQFAARHFAHLAKRLRFQNWIVWEGLSLPVRMIMPAHYSIACFSKGEPRPLPGLMSGSKTALERESLTALREFYCLRQSCVQGRSALGHGDRQPPTDLWWDIHRLKHNSRRVDHPCQLPPALMHRLIALFSHPSETVLDPFNGCGTTTLCAEQLNRRYIGIEMSERYHRAASERHDLLRRGGDPFAKAKAVPKSKNSRVKRIGGVEYAVPKRKLQLEVREIAKRLGRLPTREEVERHSQYPIAYFDEYFISWGEVCAAARTTGMRETRNHALPDDTPPRQGVFAFRGDLSR